MSMAPGKMIKEMWKSLPEGASAFLLKAVALFTGWKVLYMLILLPIGEPDGWLVRQLGNATAATLNTVYGADRYEVRHIILPNRGGSSAGATCAQVYREGKRADIGIYAPCNGMELMVLAVGFILCFEGHWRRKTGYILAAVIGIFLINVIRISLLVVIKSDHPAWFEFAHKYLFNMAGYATVFLVWMQYVRGMRLPVPSHPSMPAAA